MWDVASIAAQQAEQPTGIFSGHWSLLWSVTFSPDDRLLANGGSDQTVQLWDVVSGECRAVLYGHTNEIYAVAFHPGGCLLASCSADETIRLWDVHTGECIGVLRRQGMDISEARGLTEVQRAALKALGAVEREEPTVR